MNFRKGLSYFRDTFASYLDLKSNYKPKILSYLITNQCNSHCVTCNAWKKSEFEYIETESLANLLSNSLFADVRHVGISGGEPSTFNNLQAHIRTIIETLPKIETLSITSNCILSDFWVDNLCDIRDYCKKHGVYFQFNISLDGVGKIHDIVRGTKGNFDNTFKVIEFVKENGINYQIHSTIDKYNVYHVNRILSFAKKLNADIIFRLASRIYRLDNDRKLDKVSLNDKELSFICDFFQSDDLLAYTKSPGRKLFYKSLVQQMLGDSKRLAPCYFKHQGVVLASDGTLSYCSRFVDTFADMSMSNLEDRYFDRKIFSKCCDNACEYCFHDQTGLWPLKQVLCQYFDKYFLNIRKACFVLSMIIKASLKYSKSCEQKAVNTISVIGMYGGEHVGDAAILGGAIIRILKRHPEISKVYVYSFRKDRTQCWVDNLKMLPKKVNIVVCGDESTFQDRISQSDLLLWAGGPIMELPVVLSRNYYFVKFAKSKGIPFEMEGIGYGPVNTVFGKYIISKIISSSDYVSVRSNSDKVKLDNVDGLDKHIKPQDPAFTYLNCLPEKNQLDNEEEKAILKVLDKHKGRILALNLRPMWDRYGKKSKFSFDDFIDEIVTLLNQLDDTTVVFFPMNADKYGFSDFDVAYQIMGKINSYVDFRLLEYEPSINGVITLLRNVDVALCMRFHAVIFAQSQDVPVIGIDYSLSGKGKVSNLFKDKSDVIPMENFKNQVALCKIKSFL